MYVYIYAYLSARMIMIGPKRVGQDTEAVLRGVLGYSRGKIQRLAEEGSID